jgi:hypothetical protein
MDSSLTPEHEITRRMVREFAEQEVAPLIKDHDRAQMVNFHSLSRTAGPGILGMSYQDDRPLRCELPCYEE